MTGIIFVPLLALTAAFCAAFWTYCSHVFVVICEDTAAGNEVVAWDDEPMLDWLWQGIYIAWMAGVWIVPALLLARLVAVQVENEWRLFMVVLTAFGVFWMMFPLSLMSSMAAESRMTLLHGGLFARLSSRFVDLAYFYLLSAVLIAVAVPLTVWLFDGTGMVSILVCSVALPLCLLYYGRLMGRLACIARLTPARPRSQPSMAKKKRPVRGVKVSDPWEVPEEIEREEAARGAGFVQPRDLPALETPYEGEIQGYDVNFKDVAPPKSADTRLTEEPERLADPEAELAPSISQLAKQNVAAIKPDRLEMERLARKKERAPKRPWSEGLWLFPAQPKTAKAWLTLAVGFVLLGGCVRLLQELWPF